jgi:hypothetical protein
VSNFCDFLLQYSQFWPKIHFTTPEGMLLVLYFRVMIVSNHLFLHHTKNMDIYLHLGGVWCETLFILYFIRLNVIFIIQ